MIVGFDATHALCVVNGEFQYLEHKELQVPWQSDADALLWVEFGGTYEEAGDPAGASDDAGGSDEDGSDARE